MKSLISQYPTTLKPDKTDPCAKVIRTKRLQYRAMAFIGLEGSGIPSWDLACSTSSVGQRGDLRYTDRLKSRYVVW